MHDEQRVCWQLIVPLLWNFQLRRLRFVCKDLHKMVRTELQRRKKILIVERFKANFLRKRLSSFAPFLRNMQGYKTYWRVVDNLSGKQLYSITILFSVDSPGKITGKLRLEFNGCVLWEHALDMCQGQLVAVQIKGKNYWAYPLPLFAQGLPLYRCIFGHMHIEWQPSPTTAISVTNTKLLYLAYFTLTQKNTEGLVPIYHGSGQYNVLFYTHGSVVPLWITHVDYKRLQKVYASDHYLKQYGLTSFFQHI